jgi:Flp pilus assembly protein TadG
MNTTTFKVKDVVCGFKGRIRRGSSFVEFALVSLIIIPLFFGVTDFSRVFYYASVAQGAARAGTQYAVFSQPNETNTSAVQTAAQNNGSSSNTTVTATASYWCLCTGTAYSTSNTNNCPTTNPCGTGVTNQVYSQVDTSVMFNTLFQVPLLPSTMTLKGRSVMRVQ